MEKAKAKKNFAYDRGDFLPKALAALDTDDDVAITVSPRLALIVERAMTLHDEYFSARKAGSRPFALLLRFGALGFRTPSLWAVLNKAELLGRPIRSERCSQGLVITIGISSRAS